MAQTTLTAVAGPSGDTGGCRTDWLPRSARATPGDHNGRSRFLSGLGVSLGTQALVLAAMQWVPHGARHPDPQPAAVELAFEQPQAPAPALTSSGPAAAPASQPPPVAPTVPAPQSPPATKPAEATQPVAPTPTPKLPLAEAAPPLAPDLAPTLPQQQARRAPEPHPRLATHRPTRRIESEPPRAAPSSAAQIAAAAATSPEGSAGSSQAVQAGEPRAAGAVASLQGRIRAAIQAALRYPAAAVAMQLTGRAQVQLDYQAGVVRNIQLTRSAGSPLLDRAALSAVRDARYPAAPPDIGDRSLLLLVWVELNSA